jgi:hypothetical protein
VNLLKNTLKIILIATLCSVILITPAFACHNPKEKQPQRIFFACLSGENEVPPVQTRAFGFAILTLSKDGDTLYYLLHVNRIENVTAAHIHLAAVGFNGPVIAFLYGPSLISVKFNGVLAKGAITADDLVGPLEGQPLSSLLDAMRADGAYVNAHTTQNPAGEIRGQIR